MIRTILPIEDVPSKVVYDSSEEPIVLSKALFDKLLKESQAVDLIALYMFYYYTAKWQRTNQPRATNAYCKKGLHLGDDRFERAQKRLIELGLIEHVVTHDADNRIQGWYIHIKFVWNVSKSQNSDFNDLTPEGQNSDFPPPDKSGINALSSNNINALSSNKKLIVQDKTSTPITSPKKKPEVIPIKQRNEVYLPLARQLSRIVCSVKNVKHEHVQIQAWANDIRMMVERNGITYARIETALNEYELHIGESYMVEIESGATLRDKFLRLEAAIERIKHPIKNNHPVSTTSGTHAFSKERVSHYRVDQIIKVNQQP